MVNLSLTVDNSIKEAIEENNYHFSNKSDMVRQALDRFLDKPIIEKPEKIKRSKSMVCYSIDDSTDQMLRKYSRASGYTIVEIFEMAIEDLYQEKGFYLETLENYKEFKSPLAYIQEESTF